MKEWYLGLQPRERQLVWVLGVVMVLLIFWLAIWKPLVDGRQQAKQSLQAAQQQLVWMQQSAIRLKAAGSNTHKASHSSGSVSQRVSSSAGQFGITLSRMQPQANGLQVWVDAVRYDTLVRWLDDLQERGLQVRQLDIADADEPGVVRIRRLQLRTTE